MDCHICESELDLRYQLGNKEERNDRVVVKIEVEWHCIECGFYRILNLRDSLVPEGTPWRRLDDVLNEEESY